VVAEKRSNFQFRRCRALGDELVAHRLGHISDLFGVIITVVAVGDNST
jgi:hypothetical protein